MPILTLFSAPKAFTDPATALSQRNAIRSWTQLGDVDILLMGNEAGLADTANEIGVRHLPQVALNPSGVPLVSSMFDLARQASPSSLLCIINADIILTPEFAKTAKLVTTLRSAGDLPGGFVLLSQRWDLDVPEPMDFSKGWEQRLWRAAHERGRLHRPTGSDFFLFPRECYGKLPDFTIGRAGWDNWMIYQARKQSWAVIDGTPSMLIVHQNHDYRHLPGAKPHYNHPETQVNTRLAGGQAATRYTILDATHTLVNGKLMKPKMSYARLGRVVELLLRRVFFFLPEGLLENLVRPRRWNKRLKRMFGKPGA